MLHGHGHEISYTCGGKTVLKKREKVPVAFSSFISCASTLYS